MQTPEAHFAPALFTRIHRSTIVRTELADEVLVRGQGDYAVRLVDGRELALARRRRGALEACRRSPW